MTGRRLLYLLPLAAFLAVAGYFAVGLRLEPEKIPSALIDKPVPDFTLAGLDGQPDALATDHLRGNGVTVVNIFASWCGPCRAEHPYLMRLAEDGVTVHGINYRDKPEDAKGWLKRLGDPYKRIGADGNGRVAIDWGVYGVPETFVIDGKGRIRFKQVGPITTPDLAETLRQEIARAAQ